MKKVLVVYISAIVSVALAMMFGLGLLVTKSNNNDIAKQNLVETARLYAGIYKGDNAVVPPTGGDVRVTVISESGEVLADSFLSDVSLMENHISREEIQAAKNGRPKAVTRYSETLGRDMMYYAEMLQTENGYVYIRTATSVQGVSAYLMKTVPLMLLILFLVLSLTTLFSVLISDRLTKPYSDVIKRLQAVNSGNYTRVIATESYPEIVGAVSDINSLADRISRNIDFANKEKYKLDFIINSINDGLIAVDRNNDICLVNKKALQIFGATLDLTGKTAQALIADSRLLGAISECAANGASCSFCLSLNGSIYSVTVKRLSGGFQIGEVTVAILSDVTVDKNNEKMRGEFFANASHELKTPLTAIKGFNELVSIKNKDESLSKPIEQIAKETDRMLALIGDMLKLSKLENEEIKEKTEVELSEIAREAVSSLDLDIRAKKVTVNIFGKGVVIANQAHIYELVKNLTENAVRYNVDGGKVEIMLAENEEGTTFRIADSGIGIDGANQTRIFERFYRVEKSRSRSSGGTGLGLSIVKHVCMLYNADLTLKSNVGVGTTITVTFKK